MQFIKKPAVYGNNARAVDCIYQRRISDAHISIAKQVGAHHLYQGIKKHQSKIRNHNRLESDKDALPDGSFSVGKGIARCRKKQRQHKQKDSMHFTETYMEQHDKYNAQSFGIINKLFSLHSVLLL